MLFHFAQYLKKTTRIASVNGMQSKSELCCWSTLAMTGVYITSSQWGKINNEIRQLDDETKGDTKYLYTQSGHAYMRIMRSSGV